MSRANWEDVTEATPLTSKANETVVVFETKVSALFWVLAIDTEEGPDYEDVVPIDHIGRSSSYLTGLSASSRLPETDDKSVISSVAGSLYDELVCPPYLGRIVVLHKAHTPHAWCDSLIVFCVTDDKAFDLAPPSAASISCSTLR